MSRTFAAALCLGLILTTAAAGFSQTSNGQVGGVIQDATKALIPGVTITLTNTETGVVTTQISNESGSYSFASVAPGGYRLTAELPGFKTAVLSGIQLGTAAQLRQNITLEVGTANTKVEVTVSSQQLLTESSASVGDVLPEYKVRDLPLVGNDIINLVKILPGYRLSQFSSPGAANYDTFAGQDLNSVNVTRDGLSVNDGRYSATQYGLTTTTNINPELVGEIRLILAPVDAELGRGNSQIQIQTRSGTNRFNGSALWNVQNTALNANSWANNRNITNGVWAPIKPNWRNTHDVTLTYGGPIRKNKTFFFASYDTQVSHTRTLQTNSVYTDTARQGIFRYWENWNPGNANTTAVFDVGTGIYPSVDYSGNPLAPPSNPDAAGSPYTGGLRCFSVFGNVKANGSPFTAADCPGGTAAVGPAWDSLRVSMDSTGYIQKVLTAMPHANYFASGDGLNTAAFQWVRGTKGNGGNNAVVGVDSNVNRKQINIKIDQNFNAKHRLSASYSLQHDDSADFVAAWPDGLNGQTRRKPQVLTLTGTSTLSGTMVNEARFGIRYESTGQFPAWESSNSEIRNAANEWLLEGGRNAANGVVYPVGFQQAGVANGQIGITSQGLGNTTPLYDYADTFSWAHGRHALKFGGEVRLTRSNGYNSTSGATVPNILGGASTGLASSLTGASNFTAQLPGFLATAPAGQTAARANAASLLYFLNASIASGTQAYWIASADDVKNGTWQDISTLGRKNRDQIANEWSAFWKDDWKLTQDLTLNLGLRYDYYGSPYIGSGFTSAAVGLGAGLFGNNQGGGGQFDRWLTPGNTYLTGYGSNVTAANALLCAKGVTQSPLLPVSTCDPGKLTTIEFVGPNTPNPGKVVIPTDRNNFGPAVGFAWQVPWFGKGKTAVRGGYQVTYGGAGRNGTALDTILGGAPGSTTTPNITDHLADANITAITATRALNLTDVPLLVPIKPLRAPGDVIPIHSRSGTFEAYDPNYRIPYTQNVTLQVTRNLARNMTLDVRYVGTFARKMDGTLNVNLTNVYTNPELKEALDITRAGGDAPLFDLMFAGLDLHGNTGTGYGAVGTPVSGVLQHGSAHLRRNVTFTTNLANGNYVGVINSLQNLSTVQSGLQNLPPGLTTSARILRNGCDRLANNQVSIPTRCFPEDYFQANPQFGATAATYHGNLSHNNYHSMQVQYTLRPTQGISFQTTYIWSKTLSDRYTTFVNPLNRKVDYSLDYATIPSDFRINGTFELPLGPNKTLLGNSSGWLARLVEKWQTSIIFNAASGMPRDTFSAQMLYAGGGGNQPQARPDIVGPWENPHTDFQWDGPNNASGSIYGSPSPYVTYRDPQCANNVGATDSMGFSLQASCTLNGLALVVPAGTAGAFPLNDADGRYALPLLQNPLPGNQGSQGPRMLRLPGRWTFDANLSKSFKLSETRTLQIRVDTTNVLNHPLPGEPQFSIQSNNFGQVTTKSSAASDNRAFQGQIRLAF